MDTATCFMKFRFFAFALTIAMTLHASAKAQLITIDKTKSYEDKHLVLQDYAKKVEYIPLETTNECLLGKEQNLDAIFATKTDLFIVDNNVVYRFGRDGKFKNIIGSCGQGPNEYSVLGAIAVDGDKQEVLIHDAGTNKLLFYRCDGSFVREIKLPGISNFGLVDSNTLICYSIAKQSGLPVLGLYSATDGKLKLSLTAGDKQRSGIAYELAPKYRAVRKNHNQVHFNTHHTDTIFAIDNDQCKPHYALFPSNKGKTTKEIRDAVSPFLLCETDAFANIQTYGKMGGQSMISYIIDKRNNTIYKGFVVDKDYSGAIFPFNSGMQNEVVSLYYPFTLQSKLEKGMVFGPLKEITKTLEEDANPVLMIATF